MPSSRRRSLSAQNETASSHQDDLTVEKVLDQRLEHGQLKYLVKWKGLEQLTWEDGFMWVPYTTDLGFSTPKDSQRSASTPAQARRRKSSSSSPRVKSPPSNLRKSPAKSRKRSHTVTFEPPPAEKPPPFLVNGILHYEVEEILQSRIEDGVLQYLIKWLGYDAESDCSWEPASNVFAEDKVAEFHLNHPNALQTP